MKAKFFQRGKTFYSILGFLLVCIYVPILISLFLTQKALSTSHETLRSMLGAAQETQLQYIQQVSPGRNHTAQVESLRESEVLLQLGKADYISYNQNVALAEEALQAVTPTSEYGDITTYLYFQNSNYLIASNQIGSNAIANADSIAFSGLDDFTAYDSDVTRVFYYSDELESGNFHSIYTASIFPGVIFIFDIYMPDYPNTTRPDIALMVSLTSDLKDVEICDYDSYGNLRVTQGDSTLCSQYTYETIAPEADGYFSFQYNGHFYLCCYTYNADNMSKFVLFCRDEIAEEQHRASIMIWISSSALLVICLLVAILYTKRTYKPIGSLMKRLNSNDKNAAALQDEFAVMNRAIDAYDDKLRQRDHVLSKYYLLRLLRGQGTNMLEDYHDDWFPDTGEYHFAVAALHRDEYADESIYDETSLDNAVVAFFQDTAWDIHTVSDGDFLYLVFRMAQKIDDASLSQLCRKLHKKLGDSYLSIFISGLHAPARELRRCRNEAVVVSEYFLAREQVGIVANIADLPSDVKPIDIVTPDFTMLQKLSDCIATLSIEDTLLTFDALAGELQWQDQTVRTDNPMYTLLISTIALAVYDMGSANSVEKESLQSEVSNIRSCTSIEQLRTVLIECLQAVNKRVDGQEFYDQRFEKMRDYIQTHYSDPNLDSASIASFYQMSSPSVTRLFKKYNGTGFLEYVHQTRVEKATELLKTTDLPISQIAAMVGYTNSATMNRAFKTHAGCTPGMIRKMVTGKK